MSMTIEKVQEIYNGFANQFESVILATVDEKGVPNASYAPYVADSEKNVYVYISLISQHTRNIESTLKASIMYIENESNATQIFARKRLTYDCAITPVEVSSEKGEGVVAMFSQKFGAVINNFKKMSDFKLYELKPISGRFVVGFGMAYDILGSDLNKLTHVGGGGHGHSTGGHGGHGGHGAHGGHGGHGGAAHGGQGHGFQVKGDEDVLTVKNKSKIIDHMNNDHADSVLNISRSLGGYTEATKAVLLDIDQKSLKVSVTIDLKESEVLIKLSSEINTVTDAHHTLIKLSKESREKLAAGAANKS